MKLALLPMLIAITATAHADGWKQDWKIWWPSTVNVRFEGNWTAKQKTVVMKTMRGYLWSQTKRPIERRSLLWETVSEGGQNFELIEKPSAICEGGPAHVIVRQDASVAVAQTTMPTAGLPVTLRFHPTVAADIHRLMNATAHEAEHLAGSTH